MESRIQREQTLNAQGLTFNVQLIQNPVTRETSALSRMNKSVRLQKTVHLFGQFRTDSLSSGNFLHPGFAQAIYRSKFSEKQIFSILTHARTIIQDTFVDPFLQEELMIGIRESMRFVADALQQMQCARIRR